MQMPGSIAAANLPCDDRPSDAAFGHVVFGRNATILRPLNLKSAVQRRKHLAKAKCTEEACLRRGHSPKVNLKGAQACARRGGSMDFLMESGFMQWMSERMSFTNWVKADFHETSRITLKFSAPPRDAFAVELPHFLTLPDQPPPKISESPSAT